MEISKDLVEIGERKPSIRYLFEMKEVVFDKKWLTGQTEDIPLYYMYRGIKLLPNNIRYDITVIPPKMLGVEFIKTKGHRHIGSFQEIYLVLEGEAIYLLQKEENREIKDTFFVKAKKGELITIPPHYDHLTINPSKEKTLKMGNWINNGCKSDYSFIDKMNGACFYYTKDGWLKNKNYKGNFSLKEKGPLNKLPDFSILK